MEQGKFETGSTVWCRPTLNDKPRRAVYLRSVTEEENKKYGYRLGHLVLMEDNGQEAWVRWDLCGNTP